MQSERRMQPWRGHDGIYRDTHYRHTHHYTLFLTRPSTPQRWADAVHPFACMAGMELTPYTVNRQQRRDGKRREATSGRRIVSDPHDPRPASTASHFAQ